MKIHLLTADIYNKIAAGEVVDRPYSVVKELVENAIDAGATEITVEIEAGGKSLIRVTDNGCGIEKEDLQNAYAPHATSKLSRAEDLFGVKTLGFRGEALASIAAVSEMEIVSKTASGEAYALTCCGGVLGQLTPAAGANGTRVLVKNLFFNTPARLKFLKSDSHEEGDVAAMIARFILSRPEIAFCFEVNGKIRYRSYGDGLRAALAAVYGAEVLSHLCEIDAAKHGLRLSGFIGDRNYSKPNRTYQSMFVNGRYVVNQTLASAISNAYASYLMKRQYPFYVLFLDVPPEIVDVNVHPNKADVRFADHNLIYGNVYSIVSAVLDGNSRALEYVVPEAGQERPAPAPATSSSPVPQPTMSYAEAKKELGFDIPLYAGTSTVPRRMPPAPIFEVRSPKPQQEDAFEENQKFLRAQEEAKKQQRIDPAALTFKGELFRTYLIYECGDDAYIVDQHAAHERLIYDRLRAKWEAREVVSQPMLAPYVAELNAQEHAFLAKNYDILREIGFEIEDFGGTSAKISAVPSDLMGMDLAAFLREVLASMESLRAIKLSDLLKDKLASAACKAAVKGGERLTEAEARSLLEKMDGDMGLKCPHGRPVAVHLTRYELEKLFRRIV